MRGKSSARDRTPTNAPKLGSCRPWLTRREPGDWPQDVGAVEPGSGCAMSIEDWQHRQQRPTIPGTSRGICHLAGIVWNQTIAYDRWRLTSGSDGIACAGAAGAAPLLGTALLRANSL